MSNDSTVRRPKIKKAKSLTKKELQERELWQVELTGALVKETFRLIKNEEATHGKDFGDVVRLSVLASFISTLLYNEMIQNDHRGDPDEAYDCYQDVKEAIQQSISSGFQGAMSALTGNSQDYFCQIFPEPEAANELEC